MTTLVTPAGGQLKARSRIRAAVLVHVLALIGAAVAIALAASSARWRFWPLAVITVLTIASDLTFVETGSSRLRISGSFLGLMLVAVLFGAAPAALLGVLTIGIGWLRSREAPHFLLNNLASYAWFPLVGGVFFHAVSRSAHVGTHELGFYLLALAALLLALALNFLAAALYTCYLAGSSLVKVARETLAPILPAELASALLTLVGVYVAVEVGTIGIALFGIVLFVFQYLVSQLLVSKRRSEALHRMATTDELTGLANRERFNARLETEIDAAGLKDGSFAVMLMDLDRFKEINDTLGHRYGDVLLRELGPRLAACVGPDGLVARLGGDEFAVLPGARTNDAKVLEGFAAELLACVQQPFAVDEMSLEVGASIGIARFPLDGPDGHTLLRRSDIAMYAAKAVQSGWKLYAAEHDHHSVRRLRVLSDVRRALSAGEVVVHYQPKVDLDDLRVRGAEALVRWQHPELGLLLPASFVGAVEQTGLIGPLTRHILERSIWQCAAWRRDGQDLSVAVNLSVRNLLDRELPREIERMLATYGLPPEALELEITESMIMSDPDRALATVAGLSTLGVGLSVDDFGTGHSSLANLRRLPIDELKIDQSFVSPMLRDENDLIIVRSTINLGHDLGLKVIAEGVEDAPTLERLALIGCDLAQGYHLSRPLAPDAFADWLARGGPRHSPVAAA